MRQKLYPVHFRIGQTILVLLTSCIIFSAVRAQTATLLSQGRPVVASSAEGPFAAANAVDGNAGTRWSSGFTNNEWIYVDLGSTATISRIALNWEAAYGRGYQIQVSNNATTWTTIFTTTNGDGGADDLTVQGSGRYIRMLGVTRGTQWGYSLFEFQVFGVVGVPATLLSQGRPVVASSAEGPFAAANAVDGNAGTRWGSGFTNNEWIYVDLGSTATISRVVLNWEAAYGRGYQIQVSNNATTWTTIFTTTNGDGGVDDLTVQGSGRYVRMLGVTRATQWGYSLFEFQVFGAVSVPSCATLPGAPNGLSAAGVTSASVTISWIAPNPGANCAITSYRVFQDGVQVGAAGATSALITGLAANTTYTFTVVAVNAFGAGPQSGALSVTTTGGSSNPDFGPNVVIFDPSMPMGSIQSQINSIFAVQQNNQFGAPRTAMLFKPGAYNVDIPIGFFTHIIGLGAFPDDVTISNVHSDAALPNFNGTQNFWRGVENCSVTPPGGGMKWAVSQACPFRRMHIIGNNLNLHDNFGWVSGGWISDSVIDFDVGSISQQQWISRNAQWGSWTGNVWNMVFVGIPNNLPGGVWPTAANTFINPTPISREKPFLWLNGVNYEVYVPNLRANTNGITWGAGQTPGVSIPLDQFYVARAGVDTAATMNAALNAGRHLLLTPGIYDLNVPLQVNRPNAIVMGMGYATLRPAAGNAVITTADVDGVKLAHIFVDAGEINSPVLVQIGPPGSNANHAANPITIHDLFIRVGGATLGRASVSLQINSHNTLLDHAWLWRADHGNAGTVGWDINTAANGLVVNGDNVTAYGLFVEHFQEYQTIWNGNGGRVYFYQSEIPYDPPPNRQDLWTSAPGVNGWASYKVADSVTSHEAWGMGIYSVFLVTGQRLTRAIESPVNPNVRFHHLVTVNLTVNGGIDNVINNTGGATAPGIAVNTPRVTDFP
jgi:hypothetical protein